MSDPGVRRFDGKTAIVTGAARGIGAAVVERLTSEGCAVACLDIDPDGIEQTAAAARTAGGDAIALPCDVSDESAVRFERCLGHRSFREARCAGEHGGHLVGCPQP